jgi:hypothetical protein
MKKKEYILAHFAPFLTEFYADQGLGTLPDLTNFFKKKSEADQQKKQQQMADSQGQSKPPTGDVKQ